MTTPWHCLACVVQWVGTEVCWSCDGLGRAGNLPVEDQKTPSELATSRAYAAAAGLVHRTLPA